jgi:hypothetical protein
VEKLAVLRHEFERESENECEDSRCHRTSHAVGCDGHCDACCFARGHIDVVVPGWLNRRGERQRVGHEGVVCVSVGHSVSF